ncbi:SgcJ/EcaC family oxidoreductase [Planctomicrobium sp. SH664]|uniref:SgcJ/EcaC family oxidoreductase n=1 Tax=Planctomicrobium sp. SH664 TaxID=3448125 RepID=UPI003F5BE82F
MFSRSRMGAGLGALLFCLCSLQGLWAAEDDAAVIEEIRKAADENVSAFNAGKPAEVAAGFLPTGEWIDEHGTVYQGRKELEEVLTAYFEKYPEARMMIVVESIRLLGSVAIDEGVRVVTTKDGTQTANIRYLAVRQKTEQGWKIASLRDFGDELPLTPHERLQPLAWLVGDWVNEGSDGTVKISYAWSEDKNFLVGTFDITCEGEPPMKSTQRIGWDPLTGKVRSWLFDSDGGYGGSLWTESAEGWVMKSEAVTPAGVLGSATVTLIQSGPDRYTLRGTDRIIGDDHEEDFELEVVRKAPASGK